jgi:hypothetical protein
MRRLAGSFVSLGLGFSAFCGPVFSADPAVPRHPDAVVIRTADQARFALALRSAMAPSSLSHHIILVDTSASQTGTYRQQTLQAVRDLLAALPAGHSVQLLSADSKVQSLTDSFVGAHSSEAARAVTRLSKLTPIGATDLASALRAATAAAGRPVSIAYIGDGMSTGDLLTGTDLAALVEQMHAQQASFHALLLGPQMDAHLAGVLANLTGGFSTQLAAQPISAQVSTFATGLQQAPLLVSGLKATSGDAELAVPRTVALRSDRHTLVYGSGRVTGSLSISGTVAGQTRSWQVAPQAVRDGGSEVAALAEKSLATGGLNSPYIGLDGLTQASADLDTLVTQSIQTARELHRTGRTQQALELLSKARTLDAGNPLLTSLTASMQDEVTPPADRLGPPGVDEGDALTRTETRAAIITQQMVQSVNAAIDEAKRVASEQPEYAVGLLKDVLEAVRSKKEIAPEKRQELDRRIVAALTGIESRRQAYEIIEQQLAESRANQEAQREKLAEVEADQKRLKTLIDQVGALMVQARRGDENAFEDAEEVSREALRDEPGNGTATAALVMSEAAGQLQKAYDLINLRHDRFLATLYQVELSHVPFPDEPPVQYPRADVWRALSIRRKEKYKSLSLRSVKPIEEWLEKKLDEPLPRPLQYPTDTSLGEILSFISDAYTEQGPYTMRIILDENDEAIGEDAEFLNNTTVAGVDLAGITLRNALQLIFAKVKDNDLTVMIKNEVMMVTTVETAESPENLVTRIYDVADLVVITQAGMGGMGGMGGGMGGMGGGMGGMGGGMGGMGGMGGGMGGMGGGGMGGMGGGMFSVPAEPAPGIQLNVPGKKKPAQ